MRSKKKGRWFAKHESAITGFLYSLELPLGILAGLMFDKGQLLQGLGLVLITMVIEMACAHKWIGAQTRQITRALVEQP